MTFQNSAFLRSWQHGKSAGHSWEAWKTARKATAKAGMAKRDARSNPTKAQPGKKRVEREEAKVAAAAEKAKAAAEAAARPPERSP